LPRRLSGRKGTIQSRRPARRIRALAIPIAERLELVSESRLGVCQQRVAEAQ
jgi:hypothetical protein